MEYLYGLSLGRHGPLVLSFDGSLPVYVNVQSNSVLNMAYNLFISWSGDRARSLRMSSGSGFQ